MSDLLELYQETLLEHAESPRHVGRLEHPTGTASGNNPLCGDRITVDVRCEQDMVAEVSFESAGCAISLAAASVMAEAVKGKSRGEALVLCQKFLDMLTSRPAGELIDGEFFPEDMRAFCGVSKYPMRVKCATLPWHALRSALAAESPSVEKLAVEKLAVD